MIGVTICGAVSAALGVASPYLQKTFVDTWTSGQSLGHETASLAWIFGAFACAVLAQLGLWTIRMLAIKESAALQRELGERVYEQTLYLHPFRRNRVSVGELVTYYAQDVAAAGSLTEETLPNIMSSLFPLLIAPLSVAWLLGLDVWPVLAVAAGGIALCAAMAWRQAHLFVCYKGLAQTRLGIVNEWLQNIKLLRVSGRIPAFEKKIQGAREQETTCRLDMVTNASLMNATSQFLPHAINLVGLVCLVHLREPASGTPPLTPGDIFGSLWVFAIFLGTPLRQLPWAMVTAVDALSSLRRLSDFLAEPRDTDQGASRTEPLGGDGASGIAQTASRHPPQQSHNTDALGPHAPQGVHLTLRGLKLRSEDGRLLLHVPHFDAGAGELVAVVGPVGAGKSLFVAALLGELPASFESFLIGSEDALAPLARPRRTWFSAVPQMGFVMNATLRRNVSLDYGEDASPDDEVSRALALAAFDPAAERLDAGLETALGERGVNLSGGQRQRLSLARATRFGRPIVVLDNSLAAVDVKTEQRIVNDLILGFWAKRTRLIVTHRLSLLPYASRILFLRGGQVEGYDTYSRLLAGNAAFRDFVADERRHAEDSFDPSLEPQLDDAVHASVVSVAATAQSETSS